MGNLYIVSTPIGNLEDITLRALRILRESDLIAAEDTRVARKLISAYDIHTSLTSYNEHNKITKTKIILKALETQDVALVSDAGTPLVSDPGLELVVAVLAQGFKVIPIPGASALTSALTIASMPIEQFTYLGFLPRRKAARIKWLGHISRTNWPVIMFEAPHRLRSTLEDILKVLGDRHILVARELTKLYEESFRGLTSEALNHFTNPIGEFTLVVEGSKNKISPEEHQSEIAEATDKLKELRNQGLTAKEAIMVVSGPLSRRELYKIWIQVKEHPIT